jgi:glycosidase
MAVRISLRSTSDDFDRLLADAHRRGLRVLLDYVPNHTSDRHPWFLESRSSRDNPRRDWYIWRDIRPAQLKRAVSFYEEKASRMLGD